MEHDYKDRQTDRVRETERQRDIQSEGDRQTDRQSEAENVSVGKQVQRERERVCVCVCIYASVCELKNTIATSCHLPLICSLVCTLFLR